MQLAATVPAQSRGEMLIQQYELLHQAQPGYGRSSERLCGHIQPHLLSLRSLNSILDYGCGQSRLVDWLAKINGARAYRYDPAIPAFKEFPVGRADLVINTDMLEHIPEENLHPVLTQIRVFSPNVYFQIATAPAHTILPNGENAHCTVKPAEWWAELLRKYFDILEPAMPQQQDRVAFITWKDSGQYVLEEKMRDLSDYLRDVRDKDCIVFGSAPDPTFVEDHKGQKIICCNGSAFSLKNFGFEPDFSFIHGHAMVRDNPADADVREVLAKVEKLGRVVFLDEPQYEYPLDVLGSKAEATFSFPWDDRYRVFSKLVDFSSSSLDISTGAFSVAALCLAGAKSVTLVGISFAKKGHSYNSNNRYRNHVSSDAILYGLLSISGYQIAATDKSVNMILQRIIP